MTGHTGFKGSWLSLWLEKLGAEVTGIALNPETTPNHWTLLNLPIDDRRIDIRQADAVMKVFTEKQPEIVFHLAAQPLVRRSYRDPLETWTTNIVGTASLLEACRKTPTVRAIVVITTDKCYENQEWSWGYRESDRLGGYDPYSASKAASELVAASYRRSFFGSNNSPLLATARAGNVIGGGDWSEDRLIPDLIRALDEGRSLEVRSPGATRPWQHALEPLTGYLLLGQKLLAGEREFADAWNFGPDAEGNRTVADVLGRVAKSWPRVMWHMTDKPQPHEATLLYLDSAKALNMLGWKPVWQLDAALAATVDWYRAWLDSHQLLTLQQLDHYIETAKRTNAYWTCK